MSFTQSKSANVYRSHKNTFDAQDLMELSEWINKENKEGLSIISVVDDDGEMLRIFLK